MCYIIFIFVCVLSIDLRTFYAGFIHRFLSWKNGNGSFVMGFPRSILLVFWSIASKYLSSLIESLRVYRWQNGYRSENIKTDVFLCDVDSAHSFGLQSISAFTALQMPLVLMRVSDRSLPVRVNVLKFIFNFERQSKCRAKLSRFSGFSLPYWFWFVWNC